MTQFIFQYIGDWYDQYTIFAVVTPPGNTCSRAQYGEFENGTISVFNSGTNPDGSFDEVCGWAEQADPENAPGDLIVYFYGNPGDYWILDTDFTSFSSVYSCTTIGFARYELAFILTRDRFPSNETVTCLAIVEYKSHKIPNTFQLGKAFDAFNRNNLELDWYPIVQFDDCVNDPPGNCKEDFYPIDK